MKKLMYSENKAADEGKKDAKPGCMKGNFAKLNFVRGALFTAGLMLLAAPGCEKSTCPLSTAPPTCDTSAPVAEGVLAKNASHRIGNLKFHLDDVEEHGGELAAIISVIDGCENVLKRDKVEESATKEMSIEGAIYSVTVNVANLSEESTWADVSISVSCGNYALIAWGKTEQGETMPFGDGSGWGVHVDDFDVSNPEAKQVFVSVIDSGDNIVHVAGIEEMGHEYLPVYLPSETVHYRIDCEEVGAGYTFASKWAILGVYKKIDE